MSLPELVQLLDSLSIDVVVGLADVSWDMTNVSAIQIGREEKMLESASSNFVFHYRKFSPSYFLWKEVYFFAEDERELLNRLAPAEVMFL